MDNPKRALDAFNAPLTTDVGGAAVYEITLGLAGVLEAVGSPLHTGLRPESLDAWAPTLYALTRPAAESRRLLASAGADGYRKAAQEWADATPVALGKRLIEAATAAVQRLNGISPDGGDGGDGDGKGGTEGNGSAAGPTAG